MDRNNEHLHARGCYANLGPFCERPFVQTTCQVLAVKGGKRVREKLHVVKKNIHATTLNPDI